MVGKYIGCALVLLAGTACSGVPESMHVARGATPEHIDDYVRFRTTLYFRSFDYCQRRARVVTPQNGHTNHDIYVIPETDTLYRFRMTGKAHSLTTKVRFESGTLKASVIDPFGATIEQDDETGQPRFVSRDEVEQRNHRRKVREDLAMLTSILEDVSSMTGADGKPLTGGEYDKLRERILKEMSKAIATPDSSPAKPKDPNRLVAAGDDASASEEDERTAEEVALDAKLSDISTKLLGTIDDLAATNQALEELKALKRDTGTLLESNGSYCTEGPVRRGFQIMGPEGWRTFDQDERLIMAMSSSAEPLIQSIQRTADNVLNAKSSQAELLLPLVQESVKASNQQRTVEAATPNTKESLMALYTGVQEAFGVKSKTAEPNDE